MEKRETYIISGNYFTVRYAWMLSSSLKSIESDCFIEYENKSVSLKSAIGILELKEVIPGKKVKITCFNNNPDNALNDLSKIRRLIENDYTTAIESD